VGKLNIEVAYAACAVLCSLMGAAYDVSSRRIPNALTFPAMVFGLSLHLALGGWRQLALSAAAGLLCGSIFLVFFLTGGMGGGDVKLITAAGCVTGLSLAGDLLIFTAMTGGLMAIAVALYHRRLKQTFRNIYALALHHRTAGLTPHPEFNIDNRQTLRLPYALAIAGGSVLSLYRVMVQR
jgi:prepilin peptidase CpaA